MTEGTRRAALASAMALVMVLSAVSLVSAPADADGGAAKPELSGTYYRYAINFYNTSQDYQYLIWDLGDGTVIDGRWQYYSKICNDGYFAQLKLDEGGELTADEQKVLDQWLQSTHP